MFFDDIRVIRVEINSRYNVPQADTIEGLLDALLLGVMHHDVIDLARQDRNAVLGWHDGQRVYRFSEGPLLLIPGEQVARWNFVHKPFYMAGDNKFRFRPHL